MSRKDKKNKKAAKGAIKLKVLLNKCAIALVLVATILANTPMRYTIAQLSDTEGSKANAFAAGTLDQSLSTTADFSPAVLPGTVVATKDIAIANNGSLGFKYTIYAANTSGALCDALNLRATLNGVEQYNGALNSFTKDIADYSSTTANWHFEASLPTGTSYTLQNQTCTLDFNVLAKQKDLFSGIGFSDLETMGNVINAGTWKITGVWVQTTVEDFNAGSSSYTTDGKKEITVATSSDGTGDALIAAGGLIPPRVAGFSGSQDGSHYPENAIDGDLTTYWHSTKADDGDYFWVDLGQVYPVARVKITFKDDKGPKAYKIISNIINSTTSGYNTIANVSVNTSSTIEYSFAEINARYIYILMTKMNGNPTIHEFEVFKRELPSFDGTATLTSQTFDSGKITKWTKLEWDETLVNNSTTTTDIDFAVQTSNDGSNWSVWQLQSSVSPIDLSSLPQTRFIRWKADLTSGTYFPPISTPILHEARVFYEQEEAQKLIVLNEYLPYPSSTTWGYDSSTNPKGEWIELYNNGDSAVDVGGFYFKNSANATKTITTANTNTGSTIISANDWLVVYMNGEFMNNGGDAISFYDLFGDQLDSHSYDLSNACNLPPTPDATNSSAVSGTCTTVPADKSFARIPDGIGSWVDPIPTPGEANVLEIVPMDEFANKLEELLEVPANASETPAQTEEQLPAEETAPEMGGAPAPIVESAPAPVEEPIATTTPETVVEQVPVATTAPETPAVVDETTPAPELQPATTETQTPEVLTETPANPEPQPAIEPAPAAVEEAPAETPSEPATESQETQPII